MLGSGSSSRDTLRSNNWKEVNHMHYTGTIWRPPYEAGSLLIEVTAGCTHHSCKFCTLYSDLPFSFRMSPLEHIEADLLEAQTYLRSWRRRAEAKMQGHSWESRAVRRIFLVGANPFVLNFERLKTIAELVRTYFPEYESIGCFARVTDIALKTDDELLRLHRLGYSGLTIGVESGDDAALAFMNKGYAARAIIDQSSRLDAAGIRYHFFYLAGISGDGRGEEGAVESAKVFNLTHPERIGSSMLTVYPESELYREIQHGNWKEESELEKLGEVRTLIEHLTIPVHFAMLGASNAVRVEGDLPRERQAMLTQLERVCIPENERILRHYREHLPHL